MSMVAKHAIRPRENDIIFGISKNAAEAVKQYGVDNVINASMGVLLDDGGNFVAFKSVFDELKNLSNQSISSYANIEGDHSFLEAVKKACFKDSMPKGYIKAVATPGGSGAIHHAIANYANLGDTIITSNWYWDPYKTLAEENLKKLDTFNLFNKENQFDLVSFKEKFEYYLNKQKQLLTILNTPAHNPTGYSISDNEWDEIINILKENAKNKENKIIVLVDIAYIDFCKEENNRRAFMKKFEDLDENILILFAFSASKGYTMYGLRNGALLCVSSNEDIADEFYYTAIHSNRGTWSNGTKGAMLTLTNIINEESLNKKFEKERKFYEDLLNKRASAFMRAAKEVNLKTTPYKDGFFVSIPVKNERQAAKELAKENLFVIPLENGLRFALCAVSEEKCVEAVKIIKKVVGEINEC